MVGLYHDSQQDLSLHENSSLWWPSMGWRIIRGVWWNQSYLCGLCSNYCWSVYVLRLQWKCTIHPDWMHLLLISTSSKFMFTLLKQNKSFLYLFDYLFNFVIQVTLSNTINSQHIHRLRFKGFIDSYDPLKIAAYLFLYLFIVGFRRATSLFL